MLQSKISRIMEDFIIYSCSHPTDSQSSASYVRYLCRNDKLISTCSSSHMQQAPNSSKSKFISVTFHFRCYRPHIYKFALAVSLVSVFSFGYPNYSAYNGISHTHTQTHSEWCSSSIIVIPFEKGYNVSISVASTCKYLKFPRKYHLNVVLTCVE